MSFWGNVPDRMATGNETAFLIRQASSGGSLDRDKASVPSVPNRTRELLQFELRHMLAEKAKREIRKKLMEWSSSTAGKATQKEKKWTSPSKLHPTICKRICGPTIISSSQIRQCGKETKHLCVY
ncbi:hypothetical protein IFM89_030122 [Coptis chinensis]|uniref:Uncharacterized protein n=1 Tax=Coptis chinensis TaxID=261450 RepID=A0A835LWY1_9MAGN|nr:hypothetical protein IFM89_030122 [Coptis chinensis]